MMMLWICVGALAGMVVLQALGFGRVRGNVEALEARVSALRTDVATLEKSLRALKLENIRTERWKENHMKEQHVGILEAEDFPRDEREEVHPIRKPLTGLDARN